MLNRAIFTTFLLLIAFGSSSSQAQQASNWILESLRHAKEQRTSKSTPSIQSNQVLFDISYDRDLTNLETGDEVNLTVTIQNTSNETLTGFAAILNFPSHIIIGSPEKSISEDKLDYHGYYSSIGDHFAIKEIHFTNGQFYNTPLFGPNKQGTNESQNENLTYSLYPLNGLNPTFVWLLDNTTKQGYLAPGEIATLTIKLIAEMPTMNFITKEATSIQDQFEPTFTINTAVISENNFSILIDETEYDIDPSEETPDPVSFYMTSVGLESSDVGNIAGYYLTIVNRDFSSTLELDLSAVMPQDYFVEFFSSVSYDFLPILGFSTYHSFYSMFSPISPLKNAPTLEDDKQQNGFSDYPSFNYELVQPNGQTNLHLVLQKSEFCIFKTSTDNGPSCPGIIMPPGIMTIFIQSTPMPNGNGTTMTMDAQLDLIGSYDFEPPIFFPPIFPPPPKSVASDLTDEHLDPFFPFNDSASFDVSPVIISYEVSGDSCPVYGEEIMYAMTVQGIDYPRLPGHFKIYQTVDNQQEVTLIDFQRPIGIDYYTPAFSEFIEHFGIEGGLLYHYSRYSNSVSKNVASNTVQDEEVPESENVFNYVGAFQVLVNAGVATEENALALSEARLTHYLDLSEYYYNDFKAVSSGILNSGGDFIPNNIPDGFVFDHQFSTETEVNCFSDISGVKYLDLNGNGTLDDGEPGIEGVTIQLRSLDNQVVATATTGADGSYLIEDVAPAYYALSEVIPAGYMQSEPNPINSLHHSIQTLPGKNLDSLNFGNYQPSNLQVIVFHDYNQNGIMDDGEPGLADWDLNLTQETYQYNASLESNAIGLGVFMNLRPGTHTLQGELPEYWTVTTAGEPLAVDIGNNSSNIVYIGRYFDEVNTPDVATASIRGTVFNDRNSDAQWSYPGEGGFQGRPILLTGVSDKGQNVQRTTTTDELGRYEFTNLPPGFYQVSHSSSNGVSSAWPLGGSHILRLEEGESLGAWATGGPGGAGWLQAVDAGSDSTPAVMQLLLDMDGDGVGDNFVLATGSAALTLAGTTGMEQRPFVVEQVVMHGRDSQGSAILLTTPGIAQEGGVLAGSSAVVGQQLSFGLIIEIDGQFAFSTESISFEGDTDRWPIRNAPAQFNTSNGYAPSELRNPFGQVVGSVLFAELTPLFGVDFGVEYADFGDANLTSGTLRSEPFAIPSLAPAGIFYPHDGARHTLSTTGTSLPRLGELVNADVDGMPTALADGDNDDGIVLPEAVSPGSSFNATISVAGSGYLNVWADWNMDQQFNVGEQVVVDLEVSAEDTPHTLSISVPNNTTDGLVIMRFRLSSQQNLTAYGPALDGEVEDYVLTIDGSLAGNDGGLPTSDPDDGAGVPTEFRLIGAWPNPFNPTTNISFDLPETASVHIEVVDMLGRQVMTIAPQQMAAGALKTMMIDASKLSSGVYIYRVIAEGVGQTYVRGGKFTLVK